MRKANKIFIVAALLVLALTLFACNNDGESASFTEGLEYKLINSDTEYELTGIGSAEGTEIVIPSKHDGKSVTSIGKSAFYRNKTITSVTIPDSVTNIGEKSFQYCTELKIILIPDSVQNIGTSAFQGCTEMKVAIIPESVTVIGNNVFTGCTNLLILTEIAEKPSGWHSKWNASERTVRWSIRENEYVIKDKVLYQIDFGMTSWANALFYFGNATKFTIPSEVKVNNETAIVSNVSSTAFSGSKTLTSITIPNSVWAIEEKAFESCTGLTSITIPDSVTSIGKNAFENCTSLATIKLPKNIVHIGTGVFDNTAWYHNQASGVLYLDNHALGYKGTMPSDTAVKLKAGTKIIIDNAFYGYSSLVSVTIPDSVVEIGWSAFRDCDGLASATIPDSVTAIGSYAFEGCTALTSVTISNSATSIGDRAFADCTALSTINLPDNLEHLDYEMFDNTAWYNNHPSGALCLGKYVLGYKGTMPSDTAIELKDGVKFILANAFYGCSGLISITIPDSVTSIGSYAFYACNGLASVIIPDSVTKIGEHAFYACDSLTSLTISDSLTAIDTCVFANCSALTTITIPNSVTSIGIGAFSNCTGLTSVFIPSSVTVIDRGAFSDCTDLTSIFIPSSVTEIGWSVFENCNKLTIYAESESEPSDWDIEWSFGEIPVVWGHKGQ